MSETLLFVITTLLLILFIIGITVALVCFPSRAQKNHDISKQIVDSICPNEDPADLSAMIKWAKENNPPRYKIGNNTNV